MSDEMLAQRGRADGEAALRLLETRRSVPITTLAAPGPSAAELARILTIAARVPDHGGLVPWRFIVLEGAAKAAAAERLAAIYFDENPTKEPQQREKFAGVVARSFGYAPVIVVVVGCSDPEARVPASEQDLSAGAVCMNMLIAARGLGYDGTWLTGFAAYSPGARRLLGIADAEKVAGIIHIGTAAQRPAERQRPHLAEIARWWAPDDI